jgi:hypothetical protein
LWRVSTGFSGTPATLRLCPRVDPLTGYGILPNNSGRFATARSGRQCGSTFPLLPVGHPGNERKWAMAKRYDWMPDDYRPVPGIDSRSHEGRAYYNWCLSQRPSARPLNAVERLLAHAKATSDFFEAMFGYKQCLAKWSAAECLEELVRMFVSFPEYDAEQIREYSRKRKMKPFAMSPQAEAIAIQTIEDHWKEFPKLEALLDTERSRVPLLVRWQSADFLHHAVQQTVLEGAAAGRNHGNGHDLTPEGITRYLELLARRQSLISEETLAPLIADVVAEAESRWPNTADLVIQRAEHAADAIRGLSVVCSGKQWKAANGKRIAPAMRALQRFTNPRPQGSAAAEEPVKATIEAPPSTPANERVSAQTSGGRPKNDPTITAKLASHWPAWQESYNGDGKATKPKYIQWFIARFKAHADKAKRLIIERTRSGKEPEEIETVLLRWLNTGLSHERPSRRKRRPDSR